MIKWLPKVKFCVLYQLLESPLIIKCIVFQTQQHIRTIIINTCNSLVLFSSRAHKHGNATSNVLLFKRTHNRCVICVSSSFYERRKRVVYRNFIERTTIKPSSLIPNSQQIRDTEGKKNKYSNSFTGEYITQIATAMVVFFFFYSV